MPHIHTEPGQHDLTASAFIIRIINEEPHVLLHLHRKHGKLLQPGGHVELSENPWQAIAHELEEETGYKIDDLSVLQPRDSLVRLSGAVLHPTPSTVNTHSIENQTGTHYHTDLAFTFTAANAPKMQPHEGESQDLRWLTLHDIENLDPSMIYADTVELCRHAINVTLRDWQGVAAHDFSA